MAKEAVVYPTCDRCGHTRAEHGILGPNNDKPHPRPCTYRDCTCFDYDPTRPVIEPLGEKELETRNYWVEIDGLDDFTVEFSWPGDPLNQMLTFKVSIDRGSWIKLNRPSHLKVTMVEEKLP